MDQSQLLTDLRGQLDALARFQAFIDKAQEMVGKFRPEVVRKVVSDNEAKIADVVAVAVPLVRAAETELAALGARKSEIGEATESARLAIEELDLRLAIGELEQADYDAAVAPFKAEVSAVDDKLVAIELEHEQLAALLEEWNAKKPASAPAGRTAFTPPAPAAAAAVEEDLFADLDEEPAADAFADAGRGDGVHAELRTGLTDDVSAVFDEEAPASDAGIAFGDDELRDLGATTTQAEAPAAAARPVKTSGKAVLILAEGTPDEVVYPIITDVVSLGRSRDNTIQVKNDSKVSRLHCRVLVRDGQFFIEDNKSANGTLVDGELVTERRLVGGEELIVGESFFRFRFR